MRIDAQACWAFDRLYAALVQEFIISLPVPLGRVLWFQVSTLLVEQYTAEQQVQLFVTSWSPMGWERPHLRQQMGELRAKEA